MSSNTPQLQQAPSDSFLWLATVPDQEAKDQDETDIEKQAKAINTAMKGGGLFICLGGIR